MKGLSLIKMKKRGKTMQLTVKDRTYEIEFTFEAAESETVQKVFDYFTGAYQYRNIKTSKGVDEMDDQEKVAYTIGMLDSTIGEVATIPKLTIDFLFMGLLEHHGVNGDITQDIESKDDARQLYKDFCKENPEDEKALHTGLFDALKVQMDADGFFKRIGLEQMLTKLNSMEQEEKKTNLTVVPQDHKKKQKKNEA